MGCFGGGVWAGVDAMAKELAAGCELRTVTVAAMVYHTDRAASTYYASLLSISWATQRKDDPAMSPPKAIRSAPMSRQRTW